MLLLISDVSSLRVDGLAPSANMTCYAYPPENREQRGRYENPFNSPHPASRNTARSPGGRVQRQALVQLTCAAAGHVELTALCRRRACGLVVGHHQAEGPGEVGVLPPVCDSGHLQPLCGALGRAGALPALLCLVQL